MESESVHIVYYLSREGQLEEPHLLEIPLDAGYGHELHLKDVKRWLMKSRGKSMPASFSWSYKRSYKEKYVWQDVSADEDLILPASDGDYILKGSKFVGDVEEDMPGSIGAKEDLYSMTTAQFHNKSSSIGTLLNTDAGAPSGHVQHACEDSCSFTFSDQSPNSEITYEKCKIHEDQDPVDPLCEVMKDQQVLQISNHTEDSNNSEEKEIKIQESQGSSSVEDSVSDNSSIASVTVVQQARQPTDDDNDSEQQKEQLSLVIQDPQPSLDMGSEAFKNDVETVVERMRNENEVLVSSKRLSKANIVGAQTRRNKGAKASHKHEIHTPLTAFDNIASRDIHLALHNSTPRSFKTATRKIVKNNSGACTMYNSSRVGPSVQTLKSDNSFQYQTLKSGIKAKYMSSFWQRASCKAIHNDLKHGWDTPLTRLAMPDRVPDDHHEVSTSCGCSNTLVTPMHVKLSDRTISSSILPFTTAIERKKDTPSLVTKGSTDRKGYSDHLGVELPATMALSNVTGHKHAPQHCPRERTSFDKSSFQHHQAAGYRYKSASSRYLQRQNSLPVFGSERQRGPQFLEMDLLGLDLMRTSIPTLQSFVHSDRFTGSYSHEEPPCHSLNRQSSANNRGHSDLRQGKRKSTQLLWEELLQTTQQALTTQETF